MIESELGALSPFERSVLDAASVAGNEFSTASVAAALSEDPVRVEAVCRRWGRRQRFLRNKGESEWRDGTVAARCEFVHVLYQQVIYDQLGPARRAQLHRRIGQRLEAAYVHAASQVAVELALHFDRARDYRRAARYLHLAGERAVQRGAFHEAVDHLIRARDMHQRWPDDAEKARLELELCVTLGPPLCAVRGYAAQEVEHVHARAAELWVRVGNSASQFPITSALGFSSGAAKRSDTGGNSARGYILAATVGYLREKAGPLRTEQILAGLSPELRRAIREVGPAAWGPVSLLSELNRAMVKTLVGKDEAGARELLAGCGEYIGREASNTFLRLFIRMLAPGLFAKKLPEIWKRDFTAGRLDIDVTDGRMVFRILESQEHDHIGPIASGWIGFALKAMGKTLEKLTLEKWSLRSPNQNGVTIEYLWKPGIARPQLRPTAR